MWVIVEFMPAGVVGNAEGQTLAFDVQADAEEWAANNCQAGVAISVPPEYRAIFETCGLDGMDE